MFSYSKCKRSLPPSQWNQLVRCEIFGGFRGSTCIAVEIIIRTHKTENTPLKNVVGPGKFCRKSEQANPGPGGTTIFNSGDGNERQSAGPDVFRLWHQTRPKNELVFYYKIWILHGQSSRRLWLRGRGPVNGQTTGENRLVWFGLLSLWSGSCFGDIRGPGRQWEANPITGILAKVVVTELRARTGWPAIVV